MEKNSCKNNDPNHECCGGHNHDEEHECCGGHGHTNEDDFEYLTLTLDDDSELKCAVLGTFDSDGNNYIALLPESSDEVLIYSYDDSSDEPELKFIETEEEFDAVSKVFMELYGEDNFE